MFRNIGNQKAVAMFMVLGTLLVVVILANVILNLILSQSRLTHHQVSRIQAYYAAQAGVNYAIEELRSGDWAMPATGASYTRTLCPAGCDITESDLPHSVSRVDIVIFERTAPGCTPPTGVPVCINVTATYTYTPTT